MFREALMKSMKLILLSALIGTFGCAGASVQQQSRQSPVSYAHPSHIVIYPFAVDPEEIELNRGFLERAYRTVATTDEDEKQAEIADDISQSICLNVAADLSEKRYNAVCQKRGVPPIGENILVVDGEFNDVSEGNRLSRTVIGFGAGASTLDTDVFVFQLTQGINKQVLQFSTHANSGKMPGIAVTGAPGAAAGGTAAIASLGANATMSAVKGHRSSMSSLAKVTADEIVEHLQSYLAQQGWNGNSQAVEY
jgi:Domain of unknown function (DUF4410)